MSVPNVPLTVLMPVYNAEHYVDEAVRSILDQEYEHFEFLIIDDGSTDGSAALLASYSDPRIRLVRNETNRGLIHTLNRGLERAEGRYIARMDADDVSMPDRLGKQFAFMEEHPDVGASSGWITSFGEGPEVVRRVPRRHEEIVARNFFDSSLWHPASILRKKVLDDHGIRYREAYHRAEDYKLWIELSRVTRLANLPEVLLRYREHADQESRKNTTRQLIREELAEDLLERDLTGEEKEKHGLLHYRESFTDISTFRKAERWGAYLRKTNRERRRYEPEAFGKYLEEKLRWLHRRRFYRSIRGESRFTPRVLVRYLSPSQKFHRGFTLLESLKIVVKSLIFWPIKRK